MSNTRVCRNCGQQALPGARFCRQCGSPLFRENEETVAKTRQYPESAGTYQPRGFSGVSGEDAVDTSRFYHAPSGPHYQVPQSRGSSSGFWLVILVLCVLAGLGIIGSVFLNSRINRVQSGAEIAQKVQEKIAEKQAEIAERQAERIARQAERQAELMARQAERLAAKEAAGLNAPPPAPPPAPGISATVDNLTYPGSAVESRQIFAGSQILKLRSSDSFESILKFYQDKLKQPPVARNKQTVVFTVKDSGAQVVVTIKPHSDEAGQFQIQVVRTG
jgi:ribosomal protein L40E